MRVRTSAGADVEINIEPWPDGGSRVQVSLTWHTTRPLSIDNAVAFLDELDSLGIEYIATANGVGLPEDAPQR